MAAWDEEREKQEEEEEDPEAPNLKNMMEEQSNSLNERREKDVEIVEAFVEALRAKNVPVITLNGDLAIEHLHLKIVHALNGNIEKRNSMFERA